MTLERQIDELVEAFLEELLGRALAYLDACGPSCVGCLLEEKARPARARLRRSAGPRLRRKKPAPVSRIKPARAVARARGFAEPDMPPTPVFVPPPPAGGARERLEAQLEKIRAPAPSGLEVYELGACVLVMPGDAATERLGVVLERKPSGLYRVRLNASSYANKPRIVGVVPEEIVRRATPEERERFERGLPGLKRQALEPDAVIPPGWRNIA